MEDLKCEDIKELIKLAEKYKSEKEKGIIHQTLKNKTLGMLFEKHSTRARLTFDIAMFQLGGYAVHLDAEDLYIGTNESLLDTINVLSRYIDAIMIRAVNHNDVETIADMSSIPVINGQTNLHNPCQILADLFTIYEYKNSFDNLKLAYIGDGNSIANSLLLGCATMGIDVVIATPSKFGCNLDSITKAQEIADTNMSELTVTDDVAEAVRNADIVYTSAWFVNKAPNREEKLMALKPYQANRYLLSTAKDDCIFMHSLPAFRETEVTSDLLDSPESIILDQSENKLYMQKAILQTLLGDK